MKIDNRDIFQQIGNLFYAIAVDQKIKPIEIGELKLLISEDWVSRTAQNGALSEASHFILITIDTLLAERASSDKAYEEFARFYAFNENVFTSELRRRIFQTVKEIVNLFKNDDLIKNRHVESLGKLFEMEPGVKA